jgi:hypothetical protein
MDDPWLPTVRTSFLGRDWLWPRYLVRHRLLPSLWAIAGNGSGFVPGVAAFRTVKESQSTDFRFRPKAHLRIGYARRTSH